LISVVSVVSVTTQQSVNGYTRQRVTMAKCARASGRSGKIRVWNQRDFATFVGRIDEMGNSGIGGIGQGSNSANGGDANTNAQGAGNTGENTGANSASEFVSKADFDSLAKKLDDVLADNKRYRDARRKNGGSNESNSGGSTVGSTSTNDGDGAGDNAELSTLRSMLIDSNFRQSITSAATAAGAIIPDQFYRLLDRDEVEMDEIGNVKPNESKRVVEEYKKQHPQLFQTSNPGNINGGANGRGRGDSTDMNTLLRQGARRGSVAG
jgi:hypothetical protein